MKKKENAALRAYLETAKADIIRSVSSYYRPITSANLPSDQEILRAGLIALVGIAPEETMTREIIGLPPRNAESSTAWVFISNFIYEKDQMMQQPHLCWYFNGSDRVNPTIFAEKNEPLTLNGVNAAQLKRYLDQAREQLSERLKATRNKTRLPADVDMLRMGLEAICGMSRHIAMRHTMVAYTNTKAGIRQNTTPISFGDIGKNTGFFTNAPAMLLDIG
jgi:hypothetical protein